MGRGWSFISGALLVLLLRCSQRCGTITVLMLKYEGFKLADTGLKVECARGFRFSLAHHHPRCLPGLLCLEFVKKVIT